MCLIREFDYDPILIGQSEQHDACEGGSVSLAQWRIQDFGRGKACGTVQVRYLAVALLH